MRKGLRSLCIQNKHRLLPLYRPDSSLNLRTGVGSAHLKNTKGFSIRFKGDNLRLLLFSFYSKEEGEKKKKRISSWHDFILVFTDIWFFLHYFFLCYLSVYKKPRNAFFRVLVFWPKFTCTWKTIEIIQDVELILV